jgi:hypothetical protein
MLSRTDLPRWQDMSDLDKGAALPYLYAREYHGEEYARDEYPVKYLDDPHLVALNRLDACNHAVSLDYEAGRLSTDEFARLSTLAHLEAERRAYLADARSRRLRDDEDEDDVPGLAHSLFNALMDQLPNPYFYAALLVGGLAAAGVAAFFDAGWPIAILLGLTVFFFFHVVVFPDAPRIGALRLRKNAEAEHDLALTRINELLDVLADTVYPSERADLLDQLANEQQTLASAARAAWSNHEDEATAEITVGLLYRVLGAVERAVATGTRVAVPSWFDYAAPVLHQMAATSDIKARMALLDKLHAAYYARPDRHMLVLEAIETLPAPGRSDGCTTIC